MAALKLGLDLGTTLIDTAEMYGDGQVERIVAEAIQGRHDAVVIVSKGYRKIVHAPALSPPASGASSASASRASTFISCIGPDIGHARRVSDT